MSLVKIQSVHTCLCMYSWESLKSGLCANNIELSICNTPSSDEHLTVSHWSRADITGLWLANFSISYVLQLELSHPAHPDIIIDFRQEGGNLNLYIEPFTRCSPAQQSALFHEISPLSAQNQYLQCKLAPDKGRVQKKKKVGIFPLRGGGLSISAPFPTFLFLFKHGLNHPEMQRNFVHPLVTPPPPVRCP